MYFSASQKKVFQMYPNGLVSWEDSIAWKLGLCFLVTLSQYGHIYSFL